MITQLAYSQHSHLHNKNCGQSQLQEKMYLQHPALRDIQRQVDDQIRKDVYIDKNQHQRMGTVYTIPVVVHVVHFSGTPIGTNENISDAQIIQGMADLNDAFRNIGFYDPATGADVEIEFCLASQDELGNFTTGITRTASNALTDLDMDTEDGLLKSTAAQWDPLSYCNIWLVDRICSSFSGSCGTAGYAYLAGAHGQTYDGIVNEASLFGSSQNNSKVHIHEMGHYLNLSHTFEGCTNNDCTTNGDQVCDTPPDNSTTAVSCGSTTNSCTTDEDDTSLNNPFRSIALGGLGDQNDMFQNYMDYGFQNCQDRFSSGQTNRMRSALTGVRASLLSSVGCVNPSIPAIFFSQATQVVTEDFETDNGSCQRYKDITVTMSIAAAPTGDAQVSIVYAGTATGGGIDYLEGTGPEITFPSGSTADQSFTIRIFDDWSIESTEQIELSFSISGATDAVPGTINQNMGITINDNDLLPSIAGKNVLLNEDFEAGFPATWSELLFACPCTFGDLVWSVGTAGLSGGSMYISEDGGTTRFDDLNDVRILGLSTPSIDATSISQDMTLEFKLDIGGDANDYLEIYYNFGTGWFVWQSNINTFSGTAIYTLPSILQGNTFELAFIWNSNGDGSMVGDPPAIDDVRIYTEGFPSEVETVTCNQEVSFGPNETVYVYNSFDNKVVAKVENLSTWDYGCTTFEIDRSGTNAQEFQVPNPINYVTDKTLHITPTNNNPTGNYEITLYYSNAEITGWETATGNSRNTMTLVKSPNPISTISGSAELATTSFNGPYNTNDFFVAATFNTGFSGFGGIASGASLPIELIDFTGTLSNKQVKLNWTTSSEINCDYYEIERSSNGIEFQPFGNQTANNVENVTSKYTLIDPNPLIGHNYYRLKQYDLGGSFEIVGSVIHISTNNQPTVSIFPNPADKSVVLSCVQSEKLNIPDIEIFSMDGRQLNIPPIINLGENTYRLTTSQLSEGIYYLRVNTNEWTIGQFYKLHVIH